MGQHNVRRWQIIDDDGSRDVIIDPETGHICSGVKVTHDRDDWPAFTQLAVRADAFRVVTALRKVAEEFDRVCTRLDDPLGDYDHGLCLVETGDLTLLSEPNVDFDDRFITAASSEALAEHLEADGVHFGHDPAAGTLHLTRFADGFPDFTWCDSLRPGPSFALEFHADGRCTEEDPRKFALRKLNCSPEARCLDRRAFVETQIADFGLEEIDPNFDDLRPSAVFEIGTTSHCMPRMS